MIGICLPACTVFPGKKCRVNQLCWQVRTHQDQSASELIWVRSRIICAYLGQQLLRERHEMTQFTQTQALRLWWGNPLMSTQRAISHLMQVQEPTHQGPNREQTSDDLASVYQSEITCILSRIQTGLAGSKIRIRHLKSYKLNGKLHETE